MHIIYCLSFLRKTRRGNAFIFFCFSTITTNHIVTFLLGLWIQFPYPYFCFTSQRDALFDLCRQFIFHFVPISKDLWIVEANIPNHNAMLCEYRRRWLWSTLKINKALHRGSSDACEHNQLQTYSWLSSLFRHPVVVFNHVTEAISLFHLWPEHYFLILDEYLREQIRLRVSLSPLLALPCGGLCSRLSLIFEITHCLLI